MDGIRGGRRHGGNRFGSLAALLFVALIFYAYKRIFKRQMKRDRTAGGKATRRYTRFCLSPCAGHLKRDGLQYQ